LEHTLFTRITIFTVKIKVPKTGETMKRTFRISAIIAILASFLFVLPAGAFPVLPSSFYGKVKVNNANVADGTLIQAIINGKVYAQTFSLTYQGDSVYVLNVAGDDSDTPVVDGGKDGDTIQFNIGGTAADQSGIWNSGTNVNLDLTASASAPLATPQATYTPVPTQTAMPIAATSTYEPTLQPTEAATQTALPTATNIAQAAAATTATEKAQTAATPIGPGGNGGTESGKNSTGLVYGVAVSVTVIAGVVLLVLRRKKVQP
jgi:hypothetical protein